MWLETKSATRLCRLTISTRRIPLQPKTLTVDPAISPAAGGQGTMSGPASNTPGRLGGTAYIGIQKILGLAYDGAVQEQNPEVRNRDILPNLCNQKGYIGIDLESTVPYGTPLGKPSLDAKWTPTGSEWPFYQ
jgi:hypothetical protein